MTQIIPYEQQRPIEDYKALIMTIPTDLLISVMAERNAVELNRLAIDFDQHKEFVDKSFSQVNNRIDSMEAKQDIILTRISARDKIFEQGYVPYTKIGRCFNPQIVRTVKLLMRLADIVRFDNKYITTDPQPMKDVLDNRHAKLVTYNDEEYNKARESWRWDPRWVYSRITKWLESNGLLDEFQAITETKDADKWICALFKRETGIEPTL
ncbi:hypothetical protein EG832_05015 [bacterium]|nr:hypothetical protein [bacterium]